MTTTSKKTNNIKNGLIGSTVSSTYGAIPPLTAGQVYAANMTGLGGGSSGQAYTTGQFLTSVSNGTSWTTPSTQFANSNGKAIMTMPAGKDEQLSKAIELLKADVATEKSKPKPKLRKATER